MDDIYTKKEISEDTIEFTITIPQEDFQKEYNKILKKQLEDTEMKGFRKGKVPDNLIEPQFKNTLKIDALEKILPILVTTILQKEEIQPIAPPEYTKFPDFSSKKEMSVTINITVMPNFSLGNMKKIKVEKEDIKVEKKEINEALENIKKSQKTKEKEINDKWAKEIIKLLNIEKVNTLKELEKYIGDTILQQKEHIQKHKLEEEILGQAIKLSSIEIPNPAILFEAQERERAFLSDMQQKNVDIDMFLKGNNITMEEMRKMWEEDAQQALKTDALLRTYTKAKKIKITEEELNKRVEEIKKNAPEDTDLKIFEDEEWREYIRRVEEKQKAFQSLMDEVTKKK